MTVSAGLQGYVAEFAIPEAQWQSTETRETERERSRRRRWVRIYASKVWAHLISQGEAWQVNRFVAIIGVACPYMDNVTPGFAAETVKPIIDAGTKKGLWEDDDSSHRHSTIYFQLPDPSPSGTYRLSVYIIPIPKPYHVASGIAINSIRQWDDAGEQPEGFEGYSVTFAIPRKFWITSNLTDSDLLAIQNGHHKALTWGGKEATEIRHQVADSLLELCKYTWLDQGFVPTEQFVAVAGIQYPKQTDSDPDNAAETVAQILKAGAEVKAWTDTSSKHCQAVAFYKMPGQCQSRYHIVQLLIFPVAPTFHIAAAIASTALEGWETYQMTRTHKTGAPQ